MTAVSISPSGTETTTESVDGFVAQVTVVSSQGYVTQTEFAGAAASSEDFYNGSVGSTVDAGSSTPASSTLGQADSDGSFTTTENGVTVSLGAGATVWANGTDQVVTAGAGSTVNDGFEGTNGNDGSLTVNGSGVAINVVEAYEAITTGGSGDKIGDTAYGAVLSTSGTAVTLGSLGSQQQVVTVTGNSNTIGGATNAQTWVYGTGNIVSLGSESALEVASGSTTLSAGSGSVGLFDGATVNLATPGNTVQQEQPGGVVDVTATGADGAANVVNGNGIQIDSYTGSLDLSGTGFSGTVSGSGLTLTSNSTASFSGSYDTNVSLGSGAALTLSGSNEGMNTYAGMVSLTGTTEYGTVNGAVLSLGANSTASFSGSYDTNVNLGSGAVLTLDGSNEGMNTYAGTVSLTGTTEYGTVNGAVLSLGANSTASFSGSYDTNVNLGSGAVLTLDGSNEGMNTYAGTVSLTGNAEYGIVDGTSLSLGANSVASFTASSDTNVNIASGASLTLNGNNDAMNNYAGSLVLNGTGDTGTVDGTNLTLSANATATFTAGSDTNVNLGSGASLTLNGSNNVLNTYAGTLTLNGTGETGTVDGSTLTLGTASTASLTGSYDSTVNLGNSASLSITGTADTVHMNNGGNVVFTGTASQVSSDKYVGGSAGDTITYNFTDTGTSQVGVLDPTSSASLQYSQYSGLNGSGTKEYTVTNNDNGSSQATFFNPGAGYTSDTEYFTGPSGTGTLYYETAAATNGDVYEFNLNYSGSSFSGYYATVNNASGTELEEAEYNSSGQEVDQLYGSEGAAPAESPDFLTIADIDDDYGSDAVTNARSASNMTGAQASAAPTAHQSTDQLVQAMASFGAHFGTMSVVAVNPNDASHASVIAASAMSH